MILRWTILTGLRFGRGSELNSTALNEVERVKAENKNAEPDDRAPHFVF